MAYKSFIHSLILTLMVLVVLHSSNEYDWSSSDEETAYINLPHSDCKPEISAVLLECPKEVPLNENTDQEGDKSEGKTCETQMMVNVRVNPSFHIKKLDKFLILDEVYDPRRRTKAKIMSPYLIELSRGEPIMMYPLKFAKNVQAENSNSNNESCGDKESNSLDIYLDDHGESKNEKCQNNNVQEEQKCEPVTSETSPCETTTESCTTEQPRPPTSMCDSNSMDEAEEKSYNRVIQKLHEAFKLTPKGSNSYSRFSKHPSDKKPLGTADEFGYGHLSVENKYPTIWTNNRFVKVKKPVLTDRRRPVFKKIFMNSFHPQKLVNEVSANVAVEKSVAKRLEGKRLAQLGVVTPLRSSCKPDNVEKIHNCIDIVTEDENIGENENELLNNVDNVDEKNRILTKIDDTSNTDNEYEEKVIGKNAHEIEKRTKKGQPLRKKSQSRKFHRQYRKNKTKERSKFVNDFDKNSDKKTGFKSCECKQADRFAKKFAGSTKENTNELGSLGAKDIGEGITNANNDEHMLHPPDSLYEKKNTRNFKRTNFNKTRRHRKFRKPQRIKVNSNDNLLQSDKSNFVERQQHNLGFNNNISNRRRRIESMENLRRYRKTSDKDVVTIEDPLYYNPNGDIYSKYPLNDPRRDKELISAMKYHNEELFQPLALNTFLESPDVIKKLHKSQSKDLDNTWRNIHKVLSDIDMLHGTTLTTKDGTKRFNSTEEQLLGMFGDPNLNMNDKMGILNTVVGKTNNKIKFDKMGDGMEHFHQRMATSFPYPIKQKGKNPLLNKHKRSFLFYDDMEVPENALGNQAFYEDNLPALSNSIGKEDFPIDDGVQPCTTCGGKGRKMKPPKADIDTAPGDNYLNCDCTNSLQNKCACNKRETSIDDAWYSVYNMSAPLPYLTTLVKIFRKRRGTWWRIVPSITLSSLSGIFANANLSVLFSSHVDIFQFEKSLNLQNNQLLVPKGDRYIRDLKNFHADIHLDENIDTNINYNLNVNPENIWAINPAKLNSEKLILLKRETHKHESHKRHDQNNRPRKHPSNTVWHGLIDSFGTFRNAESNSDTGLKRLLDLGYFPTTMNILQRCPNDKHRLCLNMLDNRVPAFNIKIKMPFRENALIYENIPRVKIVKIITDATTKDALQVTVDIINKGPKVREFSVCVCNCPTPCAAAAKTTVQKTLLPHYQQTVSFLLPFIVENNNMKHKKFHCNVIIKVPMPITTPLGDNNNQNNENTENPNKNENNEMNINSTNDIQLNVKKRFSRVEPEQKIIARRRLDVEPEGRCLCVWKCRCHCIPKMETNVDFHVCHELDEKSQRNAGLLDNDENTEYNVDEEEASETQTTTTGGPVEPPSTSNNVEYGGFLWNALLLLLFMLLLGLLKAILGLCIRSIDKCGYNYVQPGRPYKNSSRCRRFCVNALFFIIFPFLFWCTCFTPREEDLLVASTEWLCSHECNVSKYKECKYSGSEDADDEDVILSQHLDLNTMRSRANDRIRGGLDISSLHGISDFEFNDDIFDIEFDDDDEANTKFVLKALAESRESLRRLYKENDSNIKLEGITKEIVNEDTKRADEYVSKLKAAQIVYRIFDQPIGDIQHVPKGFKYCIQGYFLPCIGTGYEFVNYNPLAQHRCPSIDGRTMLALRPPVLLCPKDFGRRYDDKYEVLKAADLTVYPPKGVPCINISTLALVASSVAKLASDHSSDSLLKTDAIRPFTSSRTPNDVSQITTTTFELNICSPATNLSDGRSSSARTSRTQWTNDSYLRTEIEAINEDFLLHEFDMIQEQRNFFPTRNMDTILE